MLTEGRPTQPAAPANAAPERTFTGNRGLQIEEPLIFEIGRRDVTGVDFPEPQQEARSAQETEEDRRSDRESRLFERRRMSVWIPDQPLRGRRE